MPVSESQVSLQEVLEVRGAPLLESEIWAVAHQTAQALNREGNFPFFVPTPECLSFTVSGGVQFTDLSQSRNNAYTAPEVYQLSSDGIVDKEKVYIFSLGKILYYAAEYSLTRNQPARLSGNLRAVLNAMCEENPSHRIDMVQVLEACCMNLEDHADLRSYSQCVQGLYKSILGSGSIEEENVQDIEKENSRQTSSFNRENRANRSRGRYKYRREQRRSDSRSRSRSRSRQKCESEDSEDEELLHRHSFKGKSNGENGFHDKYSGDPPPYRIPGHERLFSNGTTPGRSYHLSDITFSSSHNGGTSHRLGSLDGNSSSLSSSRSSSDTSSTVYEKYLKIKDRQKKLRALRRGLLDEDSDTVITMTDHLDHQADTRSITSAVSHTQGAYLPGMHMQYGSEMALRMGRESDRDSIISSEASLYHQDMLTLRSTDHGHHTNRGVQPKTKISSTNLAHRKQPREYYGPEFVHKASKAIIRVPIPLQGESLKNPSHARRIVVVLLTGQKLELMCDPSTTGQQLFESIITHIELPEFFFFGLTYVSDGEHFFIDPEVKLHKVAPDGWREGWKGNLPTVTFTLYLRMKFYPANVLMFRHQITRHLLYLQLRHDLLEERTMCGDEKAFLLSGLALQAEYGDYDKETMGRKYFMAEHYFSNHIIKHVGMSYIRDNTAEVHQRATGLTEGKAEIEFIKVAQQLPEYGIHFYKLLKNKNDTNSIMWIGITVRCMVLAENQGYRRAIADQHPWNTIQKISFNKRRFSIQPKPDYGQGKPAKLNYYTNSYRKGRYLLQFSTMQHRFQLKMKAREVQMDTQELTLDPESAFDGNFAVDVDEDEMSNGHSHQGSHTSEEDRVSQSAPVVRSIPGQQPLAYSLPPPYKTETSVSMLDLRERYGLPQNKRRGPAHAASTGDILDDVKRDSLQPEAYVIEMASQSQEPAEGPQLTETLSTTLQHRFNQDLLSPEQPDRQLFEVVLEKDPNTGFGITIVGGESTGKMDLGIFVKSVTPNGPADKDGRIKPGDRLIAINDQSLESLQHYMAVQMIRESGHSVKLLISQVKCPGSIRRRDYDDGSVFVSKHRASDASPRDVQIYSQISYYPDDDDAELEAASNVCTVNTSSNSGSNIPENQPQHVVADVNNTMSQVESIHSELAAGELPDDTRKAVKCQEDTDVESDVETGFDEVCEQNELSKLQANMKQRKKSSDRIETGDIYEVVLEKVDGSFGLNVTGGINTSVRQGGIFVKSLIPGGAAEQNEVIGRGDRILEVDSQSLIGKTHKQAVEALCNAPKICCLVLERGSAANRSRSPVVVQQNPTDHTLKTGQSPETVSQQLDQPLAAKQRSQRSSPQPNTEVMTWQTAIRVESKPTRTLPQVPATTPRKLSEEDDMGRQYYPFVKSDDTFDVDLKRGSTGLGFSVQGSQDVPPSDPSHGIIRIKKVFPIGPAAESKKLQPGDVILEVNKQSVKGLTLQETLATLRGPISSQVHLLMCRPHPHLLPPIKQGDEDVKRESLPMVVKNKALSRIAPSPYETESEDEPILYRDNCITPPSGFASPRESKLADVIPRAVSPPPPLPASPPPILQGTGQWANDKLDLLSPDNLEGRTSRRSSSRSDDSQSSGDSIVRSPLKDLQQMTLNSTDSYDAQSEMSESSHQLTARSEELGSVRDLQQTLQESTEGSDDGDDLTDDPLNPGEIEVTLIKENGQGLGFTISGGADSSTSGGCYIKGIVQDPALSDGSLKPGDKLIKVNGVSVANLNHFETISYLRETPRVVILRVYRPGAQSLEKKSGILQSTKDMYSDTEPISQGEAVQKTDALFSFLEGHDKSLDEHQSESEGESPLGSYGQKPESALSPADSQIALTSGDEYSSEYTDSHDATQEKKREVSPLTKSRRSPPGDVDGNITPISLFSEDVGLIKIDLEKPESGELGFGLVTAEKDNQTGIFVRSITDGSVTQQDGRLCVMDRLVQINNESLVGLTHRKAIAMLKKVKGKVTLTVSRLSSRQLELMTPPVIMEEDEEDFGNDSDTNLRTMSPSKSDEASDDYDTEEDDMNALVIEAEKLLAVEEIIELEPHQLQEEGSEPNSKSEEQKWADNPVHFDEEDAVEEGSKTISNKTFTIEATARKLEIDIPNVITDEWLNSLPLMIVTKENLAGLPDLINQLQKSIELDDPLEEYKELRQVKPTDGSTVAKETDNKVKNRFRNVLPYDINRVELSGDNDYINASHIIMNIADSECHYVASQGPLPNTSQDFWQMIWEQRVSVIAMLTLDVESRKVKCHRYWPDSTETPLYVCDSQYKVSLVCLQSTEHLDIRYIDMECMTTGDQHRVCHINYISWPDHGVPESAVPLLQCLQLVHAHHETGPIVVHCSAGIGRTGAFITIDMALAQIEQSCKCDIFEIVKELRQQRQGMIQTKDQYMLCYCACVEALLSQS